MGKKNTKKINRRRKQFIMSALQLKIVLPMVIITLSILFLNFILVYSDLFLMQANKSMGDTAVLTEISHAFFKDLIISLVIAVPYTILAGIIFSFSYCGPIYRFTTYFKGLLNGRWDKPCTLREKDFLKDVNTDINNAVGVLTEKIKTQDDLIVETVDLLESSASSFENNKKIQELLKQLKNEHKSVSERFPEEKTDAEKVSTKDEEKSFA